MSIDGLHPTERSSVPVLYPDQDIAKPFEWDGGCEDPRIVQAPDGTYVLTYVAWNRSRANICIATSRDLHIWKKYGPAFKAASPTDGEWTKSGAIVTTIVGGRIVAARIKGKYWMYWEHDKNLTHLSFSPPHQISSIGRLSSGPMATSAGSQNPKRLV